MKLVYIAHPFNGDEKNVEDTRQIIKRLLKEYPNYVFLSPLQAVGFYYDDVPYMQGIAHCFELLSRCDELWLCQDWEKSRGCCMEYAFAKAKDIPVYCLDENNKQTWMLD